jgi:class 3 adenylate cyclase
MHEILIADRIKGEREIAVFRLVLLAAMAVMVVLMSFLGAGFNISDIANLIGVGVATLYTGLLLLIIERHGYRRFLGYVSSVIDILFISASTYLSRYAADSSVASLVSTSSFVIYFPIILFSVRRHDPLNTLFTGLLAALSYAAMIVVMQVEGSFGITMKAAGGLMIRNDLFNEALKAVMLGLTGFVGWGAALRFDRLFEDAMAALKEKEQIRDMFGRYVSDELVDKILAKEIAVEGEKRDATVMFIDIRNFTPLAESIDPKTLIAILNNFFSLCISTITKHGGFIDKFIGDAIMVVFGAPEPDADHSSSAVACAIELSKALGTMNAWVRSLGVTWEFGYGIGINSGEVIVGNIGTETRMEYTALGDAVNVASRLERLTRQLERPILVGEACAKGCAERTDHYSFEGPYNARLKGKSEAVKVYAVRERKA